MRATICILTATILFAPIPALMQEWINYFDLDQRFSVNLPGAPPPVMFQTLLQMLDENGERASFDIDPDGQRTDLGRPTVY